MFRNRFWFVSERASHNAYSMTLISAIVAVAKGPRDAPMSKLAEKIPKAKKTGNTSADLRAETSRQYLIDGVNLMVQHEALRADMVAQLRRLVAEAAQAASVDEHEWAEVSTLANMEEVWVASVISEWTGIKAERLAKAKEYDPDAVKQIWCFLLNSSMLLQLPPKFKDKRVALQTLKDRMLAVGNRAKLLKDAFIKANGQCNWLVGVYELKFEATKLKTITHRPTGIVVTLDADVGIDSSFDLLHNWNDSQAELQKGRALRFKLCAFFGGGACPNLLEPWSGKCKELCLSAEARLQAIREQAAPTGAADDATARSFAEQKEQKRKLATEKASAALQARQEEATKRRRIALTRPAPASAASSA